MRLGRHPASRRRAFEVLQKLEEVEFLESRRSLLEMRDREQGLMARRSYLDGLPASPEVETSCRDLAAQAEEWERIQRELRNVRGQAEELQEMARQTAQKALMFRKLRDR